ncbi:hypothetical protein [Polaromonas sp. YR568]|uniref:hypothetical protein n=1 Tax=Polaromonas sp. YR568 TaxID=1855301 RepID=UPI003137D757
MTTAPDIITQIQTVLHADPALQAQLKSCTDANSAATLIVKAGANQGIELSEADVVACGIASPSLQSAAISDDELDLVAGGGSFDPNEKYSSREVYELFKWKYGGGKFPGSP